MPEKDGQENQRRVDEQPNAQTPPKRDGEGDDAASSAPVIHHPMANKEAPQQSSG
jgi:hypothetical protein